MKQIKITRNVRAMAQRKPIDFVAGTIYDVESDELANHLIGKGFAILHSPEQAVVTITDEGTKTGKGKKAKTSIPATTESEEVETDTPPDPSIPPSDNETTTKKGNDK